MIIQERDEETARGKHKNQRLCVGVEGMQAKKRTNSN